MCSPVLQGGAFPSTLVPRITSREDFASESGPKQARIPGVAERLSFSIPVRYAIATAESVSRNAPRPALLTGRYKCVFRSKWATDSERSGPPFRAKWATWIGIRTLSRQSHDQKNLFTPQGLSVNENGDKLRLIKAPAHERLQCFGRLVNKHASGGGAAEAKTLCQVLRYLSILALRESK